MSKYTCTLDINVQTKINKTGITLGKHRQAGVDKYKTAELGLKLS